MSDLNGRISRLEKILPSPPPFSEIYLWWIYNTQMQSDMAHDIVTGINAALVPGNKCTLEQLRVAYDWFSTRAIYSWPEVVRKFGQSTIDQAVNAAKRDDKPSVSSFHPKNFLSSFDETLEAVTHEGRLIE